jgi:hypothetical protein
VKYYNIVDKSEKVYLLPIGDIHIGNKNVDIVKLVGYIDWVKNTPSAYVVIMGDVFDVATRESPTSPFEQMLNLEDSMKFMTELFKPIKDRIICAITGNHEERLEKYAGFNPMTAWCTMAGIKYAGYSAVIRFRVGSKPNGNGSIKIDKDTKALLNQYGFYKKVKEISNTKKNKQKNIEYVFYVHHTQGGGFTIGGKLNRVAKLTNVFVDADCYLGGHNHSKAFGEDAVAFLDKKTGTIKYRRIMYVDCGSFQTYDGSYAESGALPPSHTGAPRIRMSGISKDLHVSF